MKKDKGMVQYICCLMLVIICIILMSFQFRMRVVEVQKNNVEDGLTLAALAAALIDTDEFSKYGFIRSGSSNEWSESETQLLEIFKENLQTNLNLNNDLYPNEGNGIIAGKVKIVNFWIYNHELEQSPAGNNEHYEKINHCVFKYIDNDSGKSMQSIKLNDTLEDPCRTPKDKDVIIASSDLISTAGGDGDVEVGDMTIYATIQFEISPFGINAQKDDSFFGIKTFNGKQTVTKSVVVDVKSNN